MRNISPSPRFDPWTVQSVASCYTVYVIPPPLHTHTSVLHFVAAVLREQKNDSTQRQREVRMSTLVSTFAEERSVIDNTVLTIRLPENFPAFFQHMQWHYGLVVHTEWLNKTGCLLERYPEKGTMKCPSGAMMCNSGSAVELSVETAARARIFQNFPLQFPGALCKWIRL